jgi:hypothetical protein
MVLDLGFSHPDLALALDPDLDPNPDLDIDPYPNPKDSALGFAPDGVLQGFPSLLGSSTLVLMFSVHSPFSVLGFFSI